MIRSLPCPECGYPLGGFVRADGCTCPECGRSFTRDRIERFNPQNAPWFWIAGLAATPVVMIVMGTVVHMVQLVNSRSSLPTSMVAAGLVGFGWAAAVGWFVLRRWTLEDPRPIVGRLLLPLSLLLSVVVTALSTLVAYPALWLLGVVP